jgi:glycosyltransferase 2 family protein
MSREVAMAPSRDADMLAAHTAAKQADPAQGNEKRGDALSRAWLVRLVGSLLFVALLVWLDASGALPLGQVWATLLSADPWLVGLSIAMYVPFLLVKAQRWRLVSADMGMPLPPSQALRIYAIGLAAGTFTPGQAGDALKSLYVQRLGYPLGRALGASILDRLFDVAALAVLGLVGVAVYGGRFAGQVPALVAISLGCALLVAFFAWSTTRNWLTNLISRRLRRADGRGDGAVSWSLGRGTIVSVSLLTIASFAVSTFRVWLLAGALGVWLGPLEVTGFVGLTTAAALVPVTVGGIGTRDVVAALAFGQLGRPGAEGLAVSLLILVLNVVQAITGWIVWLGYKSPSTENGELPS